MEEFHAERKENQIFVNREPETPEEWEQFASMVEDAFVHAFLTDSPCVVYPPVKQG